MAEASQLEHTIPALSAGNVVSVALQIYRGQAGVYFTKSLLAHLWFYLTLGGLVLGAAIAAGVAIAVFADLLSASRLLQVGIGLTIVVAPLGLYALGRFLAAGGLLSRVAFGKLQGQTEADAVIQPQIYGRLWSYLLAAGMVGGLLLLLLGGIALTAYVIGVTTRPLWEIGWGAIEGPEIGFLWFSAFSLLVLLAVAGVSLLVYYVTARLWLFDVVLAVEAGVSAWEAVRRSWQITQGQGWKMTAIMLTGTLVTLPILVVGTVLNLFVPVVSVVANILLFPLWQITKAVAYHDLVSVREGLTFDLSLTAPPPHTLLRRVALQTPESISLDFALGGIGSRALAWFIDQSLLTLGVVLFWYLGALIYFYVMLPALTETLGVEVDTLNLWAAAIAALLAYIFSNGYYIAFETLWRGQTPGKRFAQIRVIADNGQPIGIREASLRSIIGPLDLGLLGIGALLIAAGRSEKRLGDMAAGTLVIQDAKRVTRHRGASESPHSFAVQDLAAELVSEAWVQALTLDQYLTLRNFWAYQAQLTPSRRRQVTQRLTQQLHQLQNPADSPAFPVEGDLDLIAATYVAYRQLHHL